MTKKEREAKAVADHVCPFCRAGKGEACLSMAMLGGPLNLRWKRPRIKHPHAERTAKVTEASHA